MPPTPEIHGVVGPQNLPASTRKLGSLSQLHYADLFTLSLSRQHNNPTAVRDPERWARALFGDVPDFTERLIWRGLLGFPLPNRERSDALIAGWRIAERGGGAGAGQEDYLEGQGEGESEWIRLENESWLMEGNLIVIVRRTAAEQRQEEEEEVGVGQVSLLTIMRYKSWVARGWWFILSFVHRKGAPMILREAERKIGRGEY